MATCLTCGEANPDHARFCLACGAPLEEPAAPREMRKTVTVVFSDVIDSTPLGETLDAESYRRMLSRYFIEVSRVLEHHGGTVEKFIGDAVMAVFGIPVVHEDDALRAVRAVTELRESLHALNEELRAEFGMELRVRTGINTGEVVAGDPADGQAFATGSAVATAQRLEAAASPGEILIGDSTYQLVREAALVEPLEPLQLKGKSQPVRAWRLLGVLSGAPAFARRLDSPMVGRDQELDRLRTAFKEAVGERECRVISVIGTAGIGKSRLVKELLSSVEDDASVLTGRCLPYGKGITYWPLRDLVRRAAGEVSREGIEGLLEGDPDAGKVAGRIAGAIGIAGSKSAPEETMWAVRRLLEHLARAEPLVIAFDDLQWAEPTFLDLIEYLLGWMRDAPILIVCMARPDLLEQHPGWLGSWPSASAIVLTPLSEPEAEALLQLLSGETELTAELFTRITEAAEGNPLYVEQMLAMLTEKRNGNGSAPPDLTIPPTIHALLTARLDRLEPEDRAVIERASVIGKEFWRGAIAELTPAEARESTGPRLMTLARKDFIEPAVSIFPKEDGYRFRHILIRDAAYLGIPKQTRAQLHERYAGWLERTSGERASELDEIIGYHLEQAHGYRAELGPSRSGSAELATRAGERLAAAGRRAIVARGDVSAGSTLLTRAVELLSEDNPKRAALLTELARALMRAGDFAEADAVLTEALEAAVAAGDRRLELRATIEQEFCRSYTSPEGSALDDSHVADEVIPELEALGDDVGLARAWWLKSEADVNACRWGARAHALERALEHARHSGEEAEIALITSLHAQALYFGPTPVTEAVARCEQYLAENPENRTLEASVTGVLGGLSAMLGDFDRARSLQARARAIYEDLGLRFRLTVTSSLVGADIEQFAGNTGEAVSILRRAYEAVRGMGATSSTATMAAFLADALSQDGKNEAADEAARFSEEHAPESDIVTQVLWRMARARALAEQESPEAEDLARQALALARDTDYPDLKARSLACLAQVLGPGDEQASLYAGARETWERKGNVAAVAQLPIGSSSAA
jgi:class 3 adenylate cyclase/tetratricopeptide (TPR) repeat protein